MRPQKAWLCALDMCKHGSLSSPSLYFDLLTWFLPRRISVELDGALPQALTGRRRLRFCLTRIRLATGERAGLEEPAGHSNGQICSVPCLIQCLTLC